MPAVVFYISGHGFGHAVRQIEIIRTLQELAAPDLRILVRTSAPEWLFTRTLPGQITLLPGETDTGVVQIDSLRPDPRASLERAAAFHDELPRRVEQEVALLRRYGVRFVVSDAPPLACAAARAAGIGSAVCANFTWDWIYEDYVSDQVLPDHVAGSRLLQAVRDAYSSASAAWRLPMHGGFEAIASVEDIPFVARHARAIPEDTRRLLGLPSHRRLVLVSFGGFGLRDLPLERLDCLAEWDVVLTTGGGRPAVPPGVHVIAEAEMYDAGLRYEDLVRGMDAVVTKPGYGIVSDCVANHTAMVYTSRGRFPEYEVIVREMPQVLRCWHLEPERFRSGHWKAALDGVVQREQPSGQPRTDGARVVARRILDRLGV